MFVIPTIIKLRIIVKIKNYGLNESNIASDKMA